MKKESEINLKMNKKSKNIITKEYSNYLIKELKKQSPDINVVAIGSIEIPKYLIVTSTIMAEVTISEYQKYIQKILKSLPPKNNEVLSFGNIRSKDDILKIYDQEFSADSHLESIRTCVSIELSDVNIDRVDIFYSFNKNKIILIDNVLTSCINWKQVTHITSLEGESKPILIHFVNNQKLILLPFIDKSKPGTCFFEALSKCFKTFYEKDLKQT